MPATASSPYNSQQSSQHRTLERQIDNCKKRSIPIGRSRFPAKMTGLVRSLLGMGNPLLDIMAEVDQAILDKYDVSTKSHVIIAFR